ncbi:MAG: CRISPR-associated endonuclease Cas2 [Nitrososphaerales archaeon]
MHVIVAYDIAVERLPKVYHIMKRYLNWIQNSAFEGDLSAGQLEELRIKVSKVIDVSKDCIVVFTMDNPKWLEKVVWGKDKGRTEAII